MAERIHDPSLTRWIRAKQGLNSASPIARFREAKNLTKVDAEDTEKVLERLRTISRLFDKAVEIPGTKITLGWDAVLGLIPIVGDFSTTLVSGYFIWEAHRLGARRRVLLKMLGNIGIDFVVGTIPLVGDLIVVTWRANVRNMRLLEKEIERQNQQRGTKVTTVQPAKQANP